MKKVFIAIIFLGIISCSKTKQNATEIDNSKLLFNVDSIFVESFTTKDLPEVDGLQDFKVSEDDHRFNTSPLRFYDFKTIQLSDAINIKIVLAYPIFSAVFEGELKLVYLMTFSKSGKLIEALRVGRTESAAEWNFLETSIIREGSIKRESDESTLDEDDVKGVCRVHKLKKEIFSISSNGRLKRENSDYEEKRQYFRLN